MQCTGKGAALCSAQVSQKKVNTLYSNNRLLHYSTAMLIVKIKNITLSNEKTGRIMI